MGALFPTLKMDWWKFFGRDITYFLKYERYLPFAEERTKNNLKVIDEVLGIREKYLPDDIPHAEICEMIKGGPITKLDISLKFSDFLMHVCRRADPNKDYHELVWNNIKDFKRVIGRALKDEPLYLIPEQYKSFMDFAQTLCYASRRIDFRIH